MKIDPENLGPPVFYTYAREHGLPPRMPRGSPENIERAQIALRLFKEWCNLPNVPCGRCPLAALDHKDLVLTMELASFLQAVEVDSH